MTMRRNSRVSILFPVVFCFVVAGGDAARAEDFPFRVALGDLPGVDEVTSGNLAEGIDILLKQLDTEQVDRDYVLATLCGAYILDMSLEKAAQACTDAVEIFPGAIALNNRGVLRAFTGDFQGARDDFGRVRPENMEAYLAELKTRDAGLIAHDNFDLLETMAAKYSPLDAQISAAMTQGAEIEGFGDWSETQSPETDGQFDMR